jgi:cell division protein ZapA (FtsZ GTPase activity inhibitor)
MADHPFASADEPMSAAIAQLQDGHPVILEREGSALAALITLKDLHLLESYFEELEDRVDRREIEKAREEIGREGTVSWEQVKEESRRGHS